MLLDARIPPHARKGSPSLVRRGARQNDSSAIEPEVRAAGVSALPRAGCIPNRRRAQNILPFSALLRAVTSHACQPR